MKARIVKPAETAVDTKRLCKRPLLGYGSVVVTWWPQQTIMQQYNSFCKRCFLCDPCRNYIKRTSNYYEIFPCGGGVEYLHRDPASRRRRRKGKSRIWESKIWSRAQRNSDPRMTALARASSNSKRQTRPLVRQNAPHQQTRNCQTIIKIWS
jgi:hypothetical protein